MPSRVAGAVKTAGDCRGLSGAVPAHLIWSRFARRLAEAAPPPIYLRACGPASARAYPSLTSLSRPLRAAARGLRPTLTASL